MGRKLLVNDQLHRPTDPQAARENATDFFSWSPLPYRISLRWEEGTKGGQPHWRPFSPFSSLIPQGALPLFGHLLLPRPALTPGGRGREGI